MAIERDIDRDAAEVRPTVTLRYDDAALANVAAARARFGDVMASRGIHAIARGPSRSRGLDHPFTTAAPCACTPDPTFGMLDGWNRLHDVPNVAVVDSSCFTTGPEKNPTLTAMAIAARAADRLAGDIRDGTI